MAAFCSLQVSESELSKLTSLSTVQTKGLKRQFAEDNWINKMNEAGAEVEQIVVHKGEGIPSNSKALTTSKTFVSDDIKST